MPSEWDKFSDPVSAPADASAWDKFSDPVDAPVSSGTGGPNNGRKYLTKAQRMRQAQSQGIYMGDEVGNTRGARIFLGAPEMALSGVTGTAGVLADIFTMADPGTHDWAYRPRTGPGQELAGIVGGAAQPIVSKTSQLYDRAFGTGPLATTIKERLPQAAEGVGAVLGGTATVKGGMSLRPPKLTAQETLARQLDPKGSMGAAASTPDLTNASPELQKSIVNVGKRGDVNTQVLQRHQDAETLPVPVRLLEGEATSDPVLISRDRNIRGQVPDLARHMDDTNRALGENLEVIRDRVGAEVFSTNATEHGQALTNAYRAMDDSANARIRDAYGALRDAAGGRFPIGAKTLLRNSMVALRKELKTHYAPQGEMQMLKEWAAKPGSMTFEDFEALRTNLATIQRTSADGNARRAAGIIREQMEELPLLPGAEKLKEIADQARTLARNRFSAIEADPAYKAVVDEGIKPGDFVQKFLVNGAKSPADIEVMLRTIPEARQTVATALVNYLQDQARVGPGMTGNFSAEGYNRALRRIDPIARHVFSPEDIETLEKLGRVARYTTVQPRGSFVNNSNTLVAAGANAAGRALEGVLNIGGTNLGSMAREGVRNAGARREYRRISAPGAGLGYRRQQ